ncbi:hypothetical protein D3C81_2341350 [compost metagenome]
MLPASVNISRVTEPETTPVMLNTCIGAAGFGGCVIAGLDGFAVNVRKSLGSDTTPPTL